MPVIRIENYPTIVLHGNVCPGTIIGYSDDETDIYWRASMRAALSHACLEATIAGITERRHVTVVFGEKYESGVLEDGSTDPRCLDFVENGGNPQMAVIIVDGLFTRSDRSADDRRRLAGALGTALYKHLPKDWEVEVIIRSYNAQSEGFVSISADGTVCPA